LVKQVSHSNLIIKKLLKQYMDR